MKKMKKVKSGAASFYIVAISTLILVIIAASFAAVIISEITRTSNDDLAQSAYDSALAGVEDAKLAYYNYQKCKEGGTGLEASGGLSCGKIIEWVERGTGDGDPCDMVALILGRGTGGEVMIKEVSEGDNNMQQAYTCVKVTNMTASADGTVTESNPDYTVKVKFAEEEGVSDAESAANKITSVKMKWRSMVEGENALVNFDTSDGGLFGSENVPTPAVISLGMVQTATNFKLEDFEMTQDDTTDRGTVYLVPFMGEGNIPDGGGRYIATSGNLIGKGDGMLKSNDKKASNLPFVVKCDSEQEYTCEADVEIPRPVRGPNGEEVRNKDTFVFRVSLPYGEPATAFSLEFYCDNGTRCSTSVIGEATDESLVASTGITSTKEQAVLYGVNVKIDSTGRANDLYKRVETTLVPAEGALPYPLYAIQVLGSGNDSLIEKNLSPTCEWDFDPTGPCN